MVLNQLFSPIKFKEKIFYHSKTSHDFNCLYMSVFDSKSVSIDGRIVSNTYKMLTSNPKE